MSDPGYELVIAPTARRQPTDQLPEAVAFAAYEFIVGALQQNPHRVGNRLREPLADRHSARRGTYRVIYRIDDARHVVTMLAVASHALASAAVIRSWSDELWTKTETTRPAAQNPD